MSPLNLKPLAHARACLPNFPNGAAVAILGGSFNPIHEGHWHIAQQAKDQAALDSVLLLPARANPLKQKSSLAPFSARLAGATRLAGRAAWLEASAVEQVMELTYSIDVVLLLQQVFPEVRFVWLMGADSVPHLPQWHRWQALLASLPLAIAPRPNWSEKARDWAEKHYSNAIIAPDRLASLPACPPPAFGFLSGVAKSISSTALREEKSPHLTSP